MNEESIHFGHEVTLHGTLSIPDEQKDLYPAVLILSGSGPLDRDGNGKQELNLYNKLAQVFSEVGCATLRYDKRGVGDSHGDVYTTGMYDLVEDARSALHYFKSDSRIDNEKILIAGHSEGAMLATAIAANENIAGVMFISGAAQTLQEALQYQRELIADEVKTKPGLTGKFMRFLNVPKKAKAQGEKFDQKVINSKKDVFRQQFIRIPAKWFREHYQYDLLADLAKVNCPILAVTGEKDVQATPTNVYKVKDYVPNELVEAKIIPNMNHMLRYQEEPPSTLKLKKIYKQMGVLSPDLIITLQDWVKRHV
ncbi:alpha/beta hydrolase family protein [Piscibacillus sp. B03]|uniref:alpha/beta hydrolase family protein n=1 Tax=Piscibacillus sp. B03 TaxID=3457430 RepID=UPI003FCD883F